MRAHLYFALLGGEWFRTGCVFVSDPMPLTVQRIGESGFGGIDEGQSHITEEDLKPSVSQIGEGYVTFTENVVGFPHVDQSFVVLHRFVFV